MQAVISTTKPSAQQLHAAGDVGRSSIAAACQAVVSCCQHNCRQLTVLGCADLSCCRFVWGKKIERDLLRGTDVREFTAAAQQRKHEERMVSSSSSGNSDIGEVLSHQFCALLVGCHTQCAAPAAVSSAMPPCNGLLSVVSGSLYMSSV